MSHFSGLRRTGPALLVVGACLCAGTVRAQTTPAQRHAGAQPPTPAHHPNVVMPKPLGDTQVKYPPGAHGGDVVILELVIAVDGSVHDPRVVSGDEPFASAALDAARAWRFSPALRSGKPVAARIRFEVTFHAPLPPPPPQPEPAPPAPAKPAGKPAHRIAPKPKPIVIDVLGQKTPPGVTKLTRAEVRQLPGTFGDPFRAVGAMPGVTPIISGLPYFYVRGAPPGDVGYYIDGVRVPLLYHVGLGPSVINPAMVDSVDLYAGGYPARFGRYAGGIVAGETTPPRYDVHGEGEIRLVDAGGMVEAPLPDHRGAVLVGGRYSYTGLLLSLISPRTILDYWDYQARASYDLSPRDTIGVFAFGAYDFLGDKQADGSVDAAFNTQFHRIDLRYDRQVSARTHMRTAVTLGLDRTGGGPRDPSTRDRSIRLRSEIHHRASKRALVRGGADVQLDYYDIVLPSGSDQNSRDFTSLFPTRTDLVTGFWSDAVLEAAPGVEVTPGLRCDYYASEGAAALSVEPRISARFTVSKKVRLLHAFGIASQPPGFVVPLPGFQVGGLARGLQHAVQSSAGVEVDLPADILGRLTLFQNIFFNMNDPLGSSGGNGNRSADTQQGSQRLGNAADVLDSRSMGSSVGLELYLHRALTKRLGGFLSYTLSRSMRAIGRERFPANFDRTHVFNLALAYSLGHHWRAGARFVFYTGFPVRQDIPGVLRSEHPPRIPSFYRIDARIEKRWRLGKHGYWAFVIEMLNATLNKETVNVDCSGGSCQSDEIGPVSIPSIGVEASF